MISKPFRDGQVRELMLGYVQKDHGKATYRFHSNIAPEELERARELYDVQALTYTDGKVIITRHRLPELCFSFWATTFKPMPVPSDLSLLFMIKGARSLVQCAHASLTILAVQVKHIVLDRNSWFLRLGTLCTPTVLPPLWTWQFSQNSAHYLKSTGYCTANRTLWNICKTSKNRYRYFHSSVTRL